MICLSPSRNSIDWFLCQSNGRRGVESRLLLETDNRREGESVKNDCVSVGAQCRDLWTESHHNKEVKRSRSFFFYSPPTRHNVAAMFWSPGQICLKQRGHLRK